KDHHVVSVKSHVYLADNTLFQYTESRHQVDRFRFTEFARRQKR
ncbi:MAG: trehalose operon repressor, partial [Lactococcus lactis]|nr:trehalose operon repressor [Lactococcus lactis]